MAAEIHDWNGPFKGVFAITPSDATIFTNATRAIRATAAGNVNLRTVTGQTVVCAFAAGETRNIMADKVLATSTTATGLEGMY